jgi:hypothetical protein
VLFVDDDSVNASVFKNSLRRYAHRAYELGGNRHVGDPVALSGHTSPRAAVLERRPAERQRAQRRAQSLVPRSLELPREHTIRSTPSLPKTHGSPFAAQVHTLTTIVESQQDCPWHVPLERHLTDDRRPKPHSVSPTPNRAISKWYASRPGTMHDSAVLRETA